MKRAGFIIMLIGFLAGAFVVVRNADSAGREWQTIEWQWYAPALLVGPSVTACQSPPRTMTPGLPSR